VDKLQICSKQHARKSLENKAFFCYDRNAVKMSYPQAEGICQQPVEIGIGVNRLSTGKCRKVEKTTGYCGQFCMWIQAIERHAPGKHNTEE
ncbi:MAG: hypothetical protein IJE71_03355, partial [Clostridia bacterium]|nr:hypothetical protein [Clostridia bacterium]